MKFYKQNKINNNSAKSLELTYSSRYDGQIIMDIPYTYDRTAPGASWYPGLPQLKALYLPTGYNDERPESSTWYKNSGLIRYNLDEDALEVLTNGVWIQLKAKQPALVTIQRFGADPASSGLFIADEETYPAYEGDADSEIEGLNTISYVDGNEVNFGPIRDVNALIPKSAANIFVYVENVFQIPYTNYKLINAPSGKPYPDGKYIQFFSPPPPGKTVTVIHGFD
jgi:hypothetical protein